MKYSLAMMMMVMLMMHHDHDEDDDDDDDGDGDDDGKKVGSKPPACLRSVHNSLLLFSVHLG